MTIVNPYVVILCYIGEEAKIEWVKDHLGRNLLGQFSFSKWILLIGIQVRHPLTTSEKYVFSVLFFESCIRVYAWVGYVHVSKGSVEVRGIRCLWIRVTDCREPADMRLRGILGLYKNIYALNCGAMDCAHPREQRFRKEMTSAKHPSILAS